MGNKISILDGKELNIDCIEGRFAAFERLPYAVTLRLSKPIAKNGFGKLTVNGIEVPHGKQFLMDMIVKMNCLMVPVGSVANEYGKEYTMKLTGFVAEDGTHFKDTILKFKTMERPKVDHKYDAHDEVAIQAAREGMVLLKNENSLLPLTGSETLNCFGKGQHIFRNTATGAGLINPRWQANFLQSVKEHSGFNVNDELSKLYSCLEDICPGDEILENAKKKSDTALIFISRGSGEFLDNRPVKGGYYLTDDEKQMIEKIAENFDRKIAIINTGYPIEMGWIEENHIDSVIYTGFAGMGAGYALVEILDGRTNPSAKLPDTWCYDYYDNPSAHNFINLPAEHKQVGEKEFGVNIYYEEDIYVGYRYFDSFNKPVAYSFGHGLSYTDFKLEYGGLSVNDDELCIDVKVTNTGKYPGREVVELFVEAPIGEIEKPRRVLASFEKSKLLDVGQSETLKLRTNENVFASFDEESSSYLLEAGVYKLWAGDGLEVAELVGTFNISEKKTIEQVHKINAPVEDFHKLSQKNDQVYGDSKITSLEDRISTPTKRVEYNPEGLPKYKGPRIKYQKLKEKPELISAFVSQMTDAELCKLNVCGGADWYMPWQSGAAGKSVVIKKYGLPKMTVSDGNTGLNLKKRNIGFPSSCTVAATFNKELAYEIGKVIAEESVENNISLNLGPAMNIHRNILNGRHPEYFSEDPYLSGMMAGFHGKGLRENGCGSTYKHLFCNGSDTARKASHSIVSERALREIYFKTFQIAISVSKPTAVMTSYNAVNGIYPAENAEILQTLLRDEWGLDSFIMTDWGSYDTVDPVEMVKAGNCWLTEGSRKYVKTLQGAMNKGELKRAVLENNVTYLIKTMLELNV